jgi:hypothetical protein
MIFETLYESAQRGELLLVTDGLCHWHLRKNGQLTIREIIVTRPGCGVGTDILSRLRRIGSERFADCIVAKCPADLPANGWYRAKGFELIRTEKSAKGREINVWWLPLTAQC